MKARRNVLLVSFDCARADVVHSLDLPTVAMLRAGGLTCRSAVSPAPLTPISHASVFTGLHPHRHGLRHLFKTPLSTRAPCLAERFREAGYRTAAFVACAALDHWYRLDRGFDVYDDRAASGGGPLRRADEMAEACLDWLARVGSAQPWFCFLHFFDAHWPYAPATAEHNPYEAALRRADAALGRVLAALGRLDETLVVLFGDHGEDMGGLYANDRGGEALGHPHERGHGTLLYQTTQHVPLIFAGADVPTGEFRALASLVDIAPTLCGQLGLPVLADVDGRDIVADAIAGRAPERAVFAETFYPGDLATRDPSAAGLSDLQAVWLDAETKIVRRLSDGARWGFDLAADPDEQQPLTPSANVSWPKAVRRRHTAPSPA